MQSSFTLLSSRALASPASIRFSYICSSVSLLARRSAQHGEGLVEAYKVDADQLSLEQDVAALLDKQLVAYGLLHLSLLVAWRHTSWGNQSPDLPQARSPPRRSKPFVKNGLYSTDGPARALPAFMSSTSAWHVVGKRLQGEVVGCHLLEHVADGVGEGCAIRAERHYCCD